MLYCQHPWLPNLRQLIELHRHITQVLDERPAPEKEEESTLVSTPYCGNTHWNENPMKHLPSTLNTPLLLQVTGCRAEVQGGEAEREVSKTEKTAWLCE
jgi:hypothetical protein